MQLSPKGALERERPDFTRRFLPETLSAYPEERALDEGDRVRMNQIRAASYLHLFGVLEAEVAAAARRRAGADGEVLAPLVRLDGFDHDILFARFLAAYDDGFPVRLRLVADARELGRALDHAVPHALLVLALHLKLVTQQHYLACVRGGESLDPTFVRVLKAHWNVECGTARTGAAAQAIQAALARTSPGKIPAALRDYRLLVFAADDLLSSQASLDVDTLEDARGERLTRTAHEAAVRCELAALRKTFLTIGIVNAAFVYAMRCLGPQAPSSLAGVVAALGARA